MTATEVQQSQQGQQQAPASSVPTDQELVARARAILPIIRKNSAEGEQNRRVVEESIKAMEDAGLFRLTTAKRYGGYETSMKTLLDVSSVIAEGDGGTAWVLTLTNICNWLVGLLPQKAQDDVFGANPDAKVTGVLAPSGTVKKVDGGYRITGKWYYNSGSWHADWALMGIPLVDGAGNIVGQGAALMPRSDMELEETWFVAGMRASGSNAMAANDVFVPDERVLSVGEAVTGQYPSEFLDSESLFRSSLVPMLTLVLVGPQLGMARAALEFVRERADKKAIAYTSFARQADSTAFQLQLAEAALCIDTAHLHAYRAAHDIDDAARSGRYPDLLTRARVRADTGWVADHVSRAFEILLSAHGAGSFAESSPLQRLWRDSATAARHAIVMPIVNYEVYGKALLNREDQITPLI